MAVDMIARGMAAAAQSGVESATSVGSNTLDSTLVAGKQYLIGSKGATFNMALPTTGTYNNTIEVIFSATAAFTPTVSGGSIVGDTIPTCVSGKTYDFLFTWTGSAWLFQYLCW